MWVVLEVLICLCVVLAVVFFAGKKIGERQYLKIREEMKAMDLAFNQLIEQMELVSGHNLKVMETKTNELHELLPIIDKKTLYVRDLLDEVEEREKKRPAGTSGPLISGLNQESTTDPRMKQEIEEIREMVDTRLKTIENQLSHLAGEFHRIVRQLTDSLPSTTDLEQIPRLQREIDRITDDCRRLNSFQREFEKLATLSLESSPIETELVEASLPSSMNVETAPPAATFTSDSLKRPAVEAPLLKHSFDSAPPSSPERESERFTATVTSNEYLDASDPSFEPGLSPQQQSRSHEILHLVQQGITIPQIARRLGMVPGEVELIINIFGPKAAPRRALYR